MKNNIKEFSIYIFSIMMACLILISPTAAAADEIIGQNAWAGTGLDHAFAFVTRVSPTKENTAEQIRLNCYTAGVPQSGTKLTTYKYTSVSSTDLTSNWTQIFGRVDLYAGGAAWVPYANKMIAINIDRTQATPEMNLYSLVGNHSYDVAINNDSDQGINKRYVNPRGYGHTTKMYWQETASTVPNSGGGRYCRWNTIGTDFYLFDDSLNNKFR